MSLLERKFPASAFMFNDDIAYIKATEIQRFLKVYLWKCSIPQVDLKNKLGINEYIVARHRHKDQTKIGAITSKIINGFKSQSQILYLSVAELECPKDGPNKRFHEVLLQAISNKPDINGSIKEKPTAPIEARNGAIIEEKPSIFSKKEYDNRIKMPIIELQEHEHFRDIDGNIFPIEVRGTRTKDGMFFKAKDLAVFVDNKRLAEVMLMNNTSYQLGIDYIIAEEYQTQYYCVLEFPSILETSLKTKGVNHDLVYLTTAGLIRLVAVSRNPNANLGKLFEWLVTLFYVRQFGSYEERNDLAQSLFKQVLNDELSGLYFIDIDKLDNLYDKMQISRETYPSEKYGSYRIGKFGLSNNMKERLAQHKNKKNGYGQFSNDITLKWSILLSPSQLSKAEDILSNLLRANGFSFQYDNFNKKHKELIIFEPSKEHRIKAIYRQVMTLFPSKENELAKTLEDATCAFENRIKLIQMEANQQINDIKHKMDLLEANQQTLNIENKMALLTANMLQQEVQHKNDLLEMEIKMLRMNS